MKFGASLLQRSVPQWRSYNIDYAGLKQLIKANTTTDYRKAISIPGSHDTAAEEFGSCLFGVLQEEHSRISRFTKSKRYEIDGRLTAIQRRIRHLQRDSDGTDLRRAVLQSRRRVSRIESDILAVGEEIESLSRFVTINSLAIKKILKKYRKWTQQVALLEKVHKELLNRPGSFTKIDLMPALLLYTEYLDLVRDPFMFRLPNVDASAVITNLSNPETKGTQASTSEIAADGSTMEFDRILSRSPGHTNKHRAVFWVHEDNVVQLRIFLLQFLRDARLRRNDNTSNMPGGRRMSCHQPEDTVGTIVFEGTKTGPMHCPAGINVPVTAIWTSDGDAFVSVFDDEEQISPPLGGYIRREQIASLLCRKATASSPIDPDLCENTSGMDGTNAHEWRKDLKTIGTWFDECDTIVPVVTIKQRRSRFVGLDNDAARNVRAALDEVIVMAKTSAKELKLAVPFKDSSTRGYRFPHAVLTVYVVGDVGHLLTELESSHLTERVDAFSLVRHALTVCCSPSAGVNLPWAAKLDADIRHIPTHAPVIQFNRRGSSMGSSSTPQTPRRSSRSATISQSYTTATSRVLTNPDISKALVTPERVRDLDIPHMVSEDQTRTDRKEQKYWNEYDNGSELADSDSHYYIYVDPDAPLFPGQKALSRWSQKLNSFLTGAPKALISTDTDLERQPCLLAGGATYGDSAESSDIDSDDDETVRGTPIVSRLMLRPAFQTNGRSYGTISDRAVADRHSSGKHDFLESAKHNQIPLLCLSASLTLLAIVNVLITTGRKRLHEEIAIASGAGVLVALVFAAVGVGRIVVGFQRKPGGWIHTSIAGLVLFAICIWSGTLLAFVFI